MFEGFQGVSWIGHSAYRKTRVSRTDVRLVVADLPVGPPMLYLNLRLVANMESGSACDKRANLISAFHFGKVGASNKSRVRFNKNSFRFEFDDIMDEFENATLTNGLRSCCFFHSDLTCQRAFYTYLFREIRRCQATLAGQSSAAQTILWITTLVGWKSLILTRG